MPGIPIGKGTMPDSLDLNGSWDNLKKDVARDRSSIASHMEQARVSEKIAIARSCVLGKIKTATKENKSHCLIWDIPNDELVVSQGLFERGEKVFELRWDSLLFLNLCSREKISGEETLPVVVRSCFPSRGLYVDIEKFKKIMGIKE